MNKDLLDYLDNVAHEHGIDRETLISHLEEAVTKAAEKAVARNRCISVSFDRSTCEFKCKAKLFVREYVTILSDEISLKEAKSVYPDVKIGDEIVWDINTTEFGRIAAMTAKQIFSQKTRQTEKKNVCELFRNQLNQLITGEVKKIDRDGITIGFQSFVDAPNAGMNSNACIVEGLLRREDKIPGENLIPGNVVTALLTEINSDKPGASLIVSRAHADFVARLFEREVTEIADNLVTIKGVARDAGNRSKIAVASNEPRIDPVGACVGVRGTRVRTIVRELSNEKVDIIEWSPDPTVYVANALKPAKLQSIRADEATHTIYAEVMEDQLSLAIGKKGQNARLASKLTGWKIDIKKIEPGVEVDEMELRVRHAIETIGAVEGIGMEAAEILVRNGFASLEGISAPVVEVDDIAKLPGFDHDRAVSVIEAAKAALGQ